jgi:hypothetical protein
LAEAKQEATYQHYHHSFKEAVFTEKDRFQTFLGLERTIN